MSMARTARMVRRFKSSSFNNKFNFNLLPPPVHAYWNYSGASLYFMVVPLFFIAGSLGKYLGGNIKASEGYLDFANDENSPMKDYKFGGVQQRE